MSFYASVLLCLEVLLVSHSSGQLYFPLDKRKQESFPLLEKAKGG